MIAIPTIAIIVTLLSGLLLVYGLQSKENALKAIGISVLINVLPWISFRYLGSESTRFGFVPFAYLPYISVMLCFIIHAKSKILEKDLFLFYLFLLFVFYLGSQFIFAAKYPKSYIQYTGMWMLNIYVFFCVSYIVAKINPEKTLSYLKIFLFIGLLSAVIGCFKYLLGIDTDSANYIPLMNRNGAAFILILFVPILLMFKDLKRIGLVFLCSGLGIFAFTLVLLKSRMGLTGFVFVLTICFLMKRGRAFKYTLGIYLIGLFLLMGFLFSDYGAQTRIRMGRMFSTARSLLIGEEIQRKDHRNDYPRVAIVKDAVKVIKNNFWLGTGVGRENYLAELKKVKPFRMAKSHNFYLSYFAELGFFGFSSLLLFLFCLLIKFYCLRRFFVSSAFFVMLLTILFMCAFNEYITVPLIWIILGVGNGLNYWHMKNKMAGA